ncbi:MAG: PAS domain S-box protein, partial [archaeon]|nr:PAS domain S-box protein [archaeon]
ESEENFRLLVQGSQNVLILKTNLDGKFVFCNKTVEKILGYSEEEILSMDGIEIIHPDDFERVNSYREKIFKGESVQNIEYRAKKKDGEYIVASNSVTPILDDKNEVFEVLHFARDITDLKITELKLRESEEKFSKAFMVSPTMLGITQVENGLFMEANEAFFMGLGFKREEVIGKTSIELNIFDEKTREFLVQEFRKKGYIRNLDLKFNRKSGEQRDGLFNMEFINISGIQCFFTMVNDITEQKEAENKIIESESKFRSLVENSPDFIFIADSDGIVQFINRVYPQHTLEEIIGKTIYEFIEPEYQEITRQVITEVFKTGIPGAVENEGVGPENSTRFYRTRYVPIKSDDKITNIIGITTDITESKIAKQKIEMSNFLLNTAEKIAHTGSYEWDLKNKKIIMSDELFNIYDIIPPPNRSIDPVLNSEESISEILKVIHPDDLSFFKKSIENILKGIADEFIEFRIIIKNGEIRYIRSMGNLIFDESGIPSKLIGTVQDITERKKINEERARSQKIESIGLLAGGIAHDYNNILVSILGNIQLLQLTHPNEEQNDLLKDLYSASIRASDLTKQLLTFSKGGAPIKKPESIKRIVEESMSFSMSGSKSKAEIFMEEPISAVNVDAGQINQVINNLLINACQAMPNGGNINIELREIEQKNNKYPNLSDGKYIEIIVADSGDGIQFEDQPKIFSPYFTTKSSGNGLGLATCYSIIKNHRGNITFESERGIGTTFYVYLPISYEILPLKEEKSIKFVGEGKILIIDDDKSIHRIFKLLLKRLNLQMESAYDGEEGLRKYKEYLNSGNKYSAIISDLTIPGGLGGKETIAELKKMDPNVKVIVSSGYSTDPIMAEYKKHGFDAVLSKPFTINALKDVLLDIL